MSRWYLLVGFTVVPLLGLAIGFLVLPRVLANESPAASITVNDAPAGQSTLNDQVLMSLDSSVEETAPAEPGDQLMEQALSDARHSLGNPGAAVTVVEYSDFLCPYCAQVADGPLQQLKQDYVNTGQVRLVFKHYSFLAPESNLAAHASECANEQGGFWGYHDALFEMVSVDRSGIDGESLVTLARDAGLNPDPFRECLGSGRYAQQIAQELTAAQELGIRGTPSFLINGRMLSGAQPYTVIQRVIAEQLGYDGMTRVDDPLSAASPLASVDSQRYQDLEVGITSDGFPYVGTADAPVTLEEHSDFLCPFCGRHFNQTLPILIEDYVKTGKVKYVFRDLPLAGLHPTAPQGHVAARCVAEQGAARFWLMHDALFARQNQWSHLADPTDFLRSVAEDSGSDPVQYQRCLAAGEASIWVEQSVAAGQSLNFNATPSFQFFRTADEEAFTLVGAHPISQFQEWLDALVAGENPPQEAEPEPPKLPFWANSEGLMPDPGRPGYTLGGDQYKGDPEAKLVVIEFADFQCPACQRHALEVQPVVDERFVETGKIMWVFKHLPLQEHPQAAVAAVAAECAASQGKFWEMHHLLYQTQDRWSVENVDLQLFTLAEELALHQEEFISCLNSRGPLEQVLNDLYHSDGLVTTTPSFIFVSDGRGTIFRNSRTAAEFADLVEEIFEAPSAEK